MNNGVSGVSQAIVIVLAQAKESIGKVAPKNPDAGLQKLVEAPEVHVELHGLPEAHLGFMRILATNQEIQAGIVLLKKIGGDVRADVAGRAGQENRHVAPLVPVLTVSLGSG